MATWVGPWNTTYWYVTLERTLDDGTKLGITVLLDEKYSDSNQVIRYEDELCFDMTSMDAVEDAFWDIPDNAGGWWEATDWNM